LAASSKQVTENGFIDEMGVLLGLSQTHARSPQGSRVYDFKA